MNERYAAGNGVGWIFCVPSFWGVMTWSVTSVLYLFGPLDWQRPTLIGYLLLLCMGFAFLISILLLAPYYKKIVYSENRNFPDLKISTIVFLHVLGYGGAILFVFDVQASSQLDASFMQALLDDPLSIRKASLFGIERGIYIGYFGWLACLLSGVKIAKGGRWTLLLLLLVILQVFFELVFLNKTRPLAVIVLAVFGYLLAVGEKISVQKAFLYLLGVALAFSIFFVAWSAQTGKVWSQGTSLPPAVETLFLYLTAGYPYVIHVVETEDGGGYLPVRVFRSFFTLMSILFGTQLPPSAVLPFYELPYPTNVGTALEPFYRDAGAVGLAGGFFFLSFIVDYLALLALRYGRVAGFCLATILCLASASAFFVSKINTGPVLLAFLFFVGAVLMRLIRRRPA